MSLRRRSCNACFRSRRKCDLTYPICGNCSKTSKHCEYAYPPLQPATTGVGDAPLKTASRPRTKAARFGIGSLTRPEQIKAALGPAWAPGLLGELAPIAAAGRWQLVHDQIQSYPWEFATRAETMFIHRGFLESQEFARPLRAAFGICAASLSVTEKSKPVMFKAIDAEVAELLAPQRSERTLVDDLMTLQAAVLYQTIRLYHGGIEQRRMAEQQELMLRTYALTVLRRADVELREASQSWEKWILAESIRRTVVVIFKTYTMYWSFKMGLCIEFDALHVLPVSMSPELWRLDAKEYYSTHPDPDRVLTYEDFVKMLGGGKALGLDDFHDLLLLGSKDRVERKIEGGTHGESYIMCDGYLRSVSRLS